ncbi:MAG TPA: ATP-binding protein [Sphingobium sp.]
MTERPAPSPSLPLWRGPPLVIQIQALLIGGLLVAQLVTLFLTLVLPPAPMPRHRLEDIALTLKSGETSRQGLQRSLQARPPAVSGRGWLVSETAAVNLAKMVDAPRTSVRLFFYSPAPFAAEPSAPPPAERFGMLSQAGSTWTANPFVGQALAQQHPPRGGMGGGMGPMGGGMGPMGGPMGGSMGGSRERPGERRGDGMPSSHGGEGFGGAPRGQMPDSSPSAQQGRAPSAMPAQRAERARDIPVPAGQSGPPSPGRILQTPQPLPPFTGSPPLVDLNLQPTISGQQSLPSLPVQPAPETRTDRTASSDSPAPASTPAAPAAVTAIAPAPITTTMAAPVSTPDIQSIPAATEASYPATPSRGLFGLAPAPFVQGDFVAAMRLPDGRWSVVKLADEPFPNSWQSRVLLWFLCALAIVTPLGWIFARRLVKPLIGFARAAEQLGRDPTAPVLALGEGPAEVGRAARAFNQMQSRLRSFVDDRTAMVGAISHDLRTPLTRLRFRIEDVDNDEKRDGMIAEVEEMEAMISSVLEFIREGATHSTREYVPLSTLVRELSDSWAETGADIVVTTRGHEDVVDVDRLAVRRLIGNLVENAIKYGDSARIRVWDDGQEAIVDIVDQGAGIPPDEQDRVFEPFYRTADARASTKGGSGLGLAVSRSIARTHGGDVSLFSGPTGFTARLRLPLAFEEAKRAAA